MSTTTSPTSTIPLTSATASAIDTSSTFLTDVASSSFNPGQGFTTPTGGYPPYRTRQAEQTGGFNGGDGGGGGGGGRGNRDGGGNMASSAALYRESQLLQ
ncbi:hypothetical protein FA13DRAFT_1796506 [Coprinellus micaceus]|uniref:Uncharacterized protein n=1 Tax=Coprinellus micaceus TaxID=71717 RepID=A0A4Y7SU82_COPMI|nr:hypothetical protein FA13DRAFT_1796506 [Coprinellus micaceus]